MKTLTGTVISTKMTQTASVQIETRWQHPTYKKTIRRNKKFLVNNSLNAAVGDIVDIVETKPISKLKRWKIVKIVTPASTIPTV